MARREPATGPGDKKGIASALSHHFAVALVAIISLYDLMNVASSGGKIYARDELVTRDLRTVRTGRPTLDIRRAGVVSRKRERERIGFISVAIEQRLKIPA